MSDVVISGRILQWSSSFGIRIKKSDLDAAGLQPGAEVVVRIEKKPGRIDLSGLPLFHGDASDVSERHDEYLAEARWAELERKRRRSS